MRNPIEVRMRENYIDRFDTKLVRRMPVIVMIDGKSFHTFTKYLDKPFDEIVTNAMIETAKYLCENVEGCRLAYTQSDEISLLLVDYSNLDSDAWFDNRIQKIVSVCSSMATFAFNKYFSQEVSKVSFKCSIERMQALSKCVGCGALFAVKVFNVPKEEVTNYFYSRQLDAIRNSVRAVGRSKMSESEMTGLSTEQVKEILLNRFGVDWSKLDLHKQRGCCVVRSIHKAPGATRDPWVVDLSIPLFKKYGKYYIECFV